jgi:hypothetical protein
VAVHQRDRSRPNIIGILNITGTKTVNASAAIGAYAAKIADAA